MVVEGIDGVGKNTQYTLLCGRLMRANLPIVSASFPQYGHPSAAPLEKYLHSKEMDPTLVPPHLAAPLFAIDHASANHRIRAALQAGTHVVLDRYVNSNYGHQAAKLEDPAEREAFLGQIMAIEHISLDVPHPDFNILLDLPAAVSHERAVRRAHSDGRALDGHEVNVEYQERVRQTFLELAGARPQQFEVIDCMDGEREIGIEEIHGMVWKAVEKRIAA